MNQAEVPEARHVAGRGAWRSASSTMLKLRSRFRREGVQRSSRPIALLAVSLLLVLAALGGIALTVLSGTLISVDGLFLTLILLTMLAIIAGNLLFVMRDVLGAQRKGQPPAPATPRDSAPAAKSSPAATTPSTAGSGTEAATKLAPAPTPPTAQVQLPHAPAKQEPPVEGLKSGTVFIAADCPMPSNIGVQQPSVNSQAAAQVAWRIADCESAAQLERPLHQADMEIFYLVGALQGSAWDFDRKRAVAKALRPVLESVTARGHNAVEIWRISAVSLLGLQHVRLVAYPRHIQKRRFVLERTGHADNGHAPVEIHRSTPASMETVKAA